MVKNELIEPNSTITFVVENGVADRLDRYITQQFSHYSRTFFQHLIRGCSAAGTPAQGKSSDFRCPKSKPDLR